MPGPRIGGQAVTLSDGRVLVVGGYVLGPSWENLSSTVIYSPSTKTWSSAGSLTAAPDGQLVALPDGGALMVENKAWDPDTGEYVPRASERFDPATGTWAEVGPMVTLRVWPAAVALGDGRVLVAGGVEAETWSDDDGQTSILTASVEVFDPSTNAWSAILSMPSARENGAAVLLADGSVLVAGGDLGRQGWASTPGGFDIQALADAVRYHP
jgi:hypothetical protein